jgi:hypothetical protein
MCMLLVLYQRVEVRPEAAADPWIRVEKTLKINKSTNKQLILDNQNINDRKNYYYFTNAAYFPFALSEKHIQNLHTRVCKYQARKS